MRNYIISTLICMTLFIFYGCDIDKRMFEVGDMVITRVDRRIGQVVATTKWTIDGFNYRAYKVRFMTTTSQATNCISSTNRPIKIKVWFRNPELERWNGEIK